MENKRLNEIEKEFLIDKNIELFKIIVLVCNGCCLQHQLKEILVSIGVYKNNSDFYRAMKKLKEKKLITTKKLSSTNNYVVFTSIFANAKLKKKNKNQINIKTQNIYSNKKSIILNLFILEHLLLLIKK